MVGTAQAVPYPDIDREKKADKKNVSVSSLKCNNINVNVNGLELDVFPPFLGGGEVAAEAAEANTDTSSFASSGSNDKTEFNDFRFICINNNNNTVVAAEEPVPPVEPPGPPETCEDCFRVLDATEQAAFFPITMTNLIQEVNDIQEMCDYLANLPNDQNPLDNQQREDAHEAIQAKLIQAGIPQTDIDFILDCLIGFGLIIDPTP